MTNPRDHGNGVDPQVIGVPKATPLEGNEACPHCGCTSLSSIEVEIEKPAILKGTKAVGVYVGCPACQYASPMITRAV